LVDAKVDATKPLLQQPLRRIDNRIHELVRSARELKPATGAADSKSRS
jgi:hypothetical protein